MRILSGLALFVSSVALAFSASLLALEVTHAQLRAPVALKPAARVAAAPVPQVDGVAPAAWPALFGTPQPAQPPEAPISAATNYTLSGLMIGEDQSWAMVSDGTGTTLIRTGETLSGGETVLDIERTGVRIDRRGTELLIAFSETAAQAVALPPVPAAVIARRQEDMIAELDAGALRQADLRQLLGRAGGVELVTRDDGPDALRILWTRPGQLYDSIGLKKDDMVVSVNGISTGDIPSMSALAGGILDSTEIVVEIVRAGATRTLRVALSNDD